MSKYAVVTGSSGLVGSESVNFFSNKNFKIVGIDNNFRELFFGKEGRTISKKNFQFQKVKNFKHFNIDIRNYESLEKIFAKYRNKIKLIIHAAAQPSHDYAIRNPKLDFHINATGTLNLLELTREYCKNAVFIFVSTNKVYGDNPNYLTFNEFKSRFDIKPNNSFYKGINESLSIDNCIHSLFGVSKSAADLLVQEYGKNIKLKTGVFRLGCITGPNHAGVELHGFLNYLIRTNLKKNKYKIFGYKGKQVRDNIHASDLINCFWEFYKKPRNGEVYNIGGGRKNSCSVIEAISKVEKITGIKMNYKFVKKERTGDHIWYISNNSKFKKHYKKWKVRCNLKYILKDIVKNIKKS